MAPGLQGVDHIHVMVRDRDVAESWYARVLGLRRMPELEFWSADGGPLTISDAAKRIHLALFERRAQPSRTTVALRVSAAQFEAWRHHLVAALGREPLLEDHQVAWSLYFADPDGNPYEITTYEYEPLRAALQEVASPA